ncbi:MAG: hypothetical protein HQL44_15315 [Alphaproteobacteria bacterium]|nr:hypothetical protein [Alphaproteobacteria bacterium]
MAPKSNSGLRHLWDGLRLLFSSVLFWFVVNASLLALLLLAHFGCAVVRGYAWWGDVYNVALSLLSGGVISFLFYFLVVFLPEKRKKTFIKQNLRKVYAEIKEAILYMVVFASQKGGRSDLSTDVDFIKGLMSPEGFRAVFEGGRESTEGFYAFRNYMSGDVFEYREIILNLHLLAKQIDFVLHNYPIADQKLFDFFKRLEMYLIRIERKGPGALEEKELSLLIWEMFGGWNYADGFCGYDVIERMIEEI